MGIFPDPKSCIRQEPSVYPFFNIFSKKQLFSIKISQPLSYHVDGETPRSQKYDFFFVVRSLFIAMTCAKISDLWALIGRRRMYNIRSLINCRVEGTDFILRLGKVVETLI